MAGAEGLWGTKETRGPVKVISDVTWKGRRGLRKAWKPNGSLGRVLGGCSLEAAWILIERYNHIRAERGCPGLRGTKGGLATGTGGGTGSLRERLAEVPWPWFCLVTWPLGHLGLVAVPLKAPVACTETLASCLVEDMRWRMIKKR